jgi:mannosyltransferase OCH1-like enzyme
MNQRWKWCAFALGPLLFGWVFVSMTIFGAQTTERKTLLEQSLSPKLGEVQANLQPGRMHATNHPIEHQLTQFVNHQSTAFPTTNVTSDDVRYVLHTKVTLDEIKPLRAMLFAPCREGLPSVDCMVATARCNRKATDIARRRSTPPMPFRSASTDKIPRRLWFTALSPLASDKKLPINFADNVVEIIDTYRKAWNNPDAPATILGDFECEQLVAKYEPRLTKFYKAERQGMYRSDMCRIAALFGGGYYFDLDLIVVWPPVPHKDHTFVVGKCAYKEECVSQTFIGSTPGHPVLRMILESILDIYTGKVKKANWVGTHATFLAIEKWKSRTPNWASELKMLPELHVQKLAKTELAQQWMIQTPTQGQRTGVCNYVIVDDENQDMLYFYSRFMGATWCGPQWEC